MANDNDPKAKIPTTKLKIDGLELEVEVYQWFTQDEEDEYSAIYFGDREIDLKKMFDDEDDGKETKTTKKEERTEFSFKVSSEQMRESKKYLIEHACRNLSWDEYQVLKPEIRDKIYTETDAIIHKKK